MLDSAERHPGAIGQVTSLAEARTTVLLDEIVTMVGADERLIDPRVRRVCALRTRCSPTTLRAYLDSFGDIAAPRSGCTCTRTPFATACVGSRRCWRRPAIPMCGCCFR